MQDRYSWPWSNILSTSLDKSQVKFCSSASREASWEAGTGRGSVSYPMHLPAATPGVRRHWRGAAGLCLIGDDPRHPQHPSGRGRRRIRGQNNETVIRSSGLGKTARRWADLQACHVLLDFNQLIRDLFIWAPPWPSRVRIEDFSSRSAAVFENNSIRTAAM
jgi:hypothetical protein